MLADLGPGTMLGEASFLETGNRGANANVVAKTDVQVLVFVVLLLYVGLACVMIWSMHGWIM